MSFIAAAAAIAAKVAEKVESNRATVNQIKGPVQNSNTGSIINLLQQGAKLYNGMNSAKTVN